MGGNSGDLNEDKSNEEAFHPNYIPQCFFIDGSNDEQIPCSFTLMPVKIELFLLCNYFIFLLIYFLFLAGYSRWRFAGAFFHSSTNQMLVMLHTYDAFSLFIPHRDCGFW